MNNIYDLHSYQKKVSTSLQIKKMLFNTKNQEVLTEYFKDTSDSKTITINGKTAEAEIFEQIASSFQNSKYIDLSKQSLSEDILLNYVKDGVTVEVKNNLNLYTFELGQENIFCTINGDYEHAYFFKSSYEDFGRMAGGIGEYKSFKEILDIALTRIPTKLESLQNSINDNLNTLADKLDDPQTAKTIESYFEKMSTFNNLSFNNIMLISIAAEDRDMNISKVASFNAWKKITDSDGNRAQIAKGEKGLPVIVPIEFIKYQQDDNGNYVLNSQKKKIPIIDEKTAKPQKGLKFSGGFVFDVSQLENEEAIAKTLNLGYRDTEPNIDDKTVEDLLANISKKYDVPIKFDNITSSAKAYYSIDKDEIVLSDSLSNPEKISSAFHELGHKILHSHLFKENPELYKNLHKNSTKKFLEGEAESFAKILSQLYGIDNKSELYISSWGNSGSDLRDMIEKISTAALEAIKILGLNQLHRTVSDVSYEQKQDSKRKNISIVAELAKAKSINSSNAKSYSNVSSLAR